MPKEEMTFAELKEEYTKAINRADDIWKIFLENFLVHVEKIVKEEKNNDI